ncbi:MAG: fumarylacetoacetate hydrolase family protein [Variovorax sp.]|nr:fumarylacetoacetate hydrolase family protein [Variovorax sp.]
METEQTDFPAAQDVAEWPTKQHADSRRFEPFAAARGIRTMPDAYRVQDRFNALRSASRAVSRAGYKIGLTSTAMQAMCGIDTPVAGVVFADRVHASGAVLKPSAYGRFGIEFEIAVRIGRDLAPSDRSGQPVTLAEVVAAIDGVAPAIEIVDDRGCDYKTLDMLSLVADNAWNAGIVVGTFQSSWPDLAAVEGSVTTEDGSVLDTGRGADVLGNPLLSVVWLAEHLAASGGSLRSGDIVMTGSMVTTKFPSTSGRFRFEVSGLGSVEVQVDAR